MNSIDNLRSLDPKKVIYADVCIVGSGPAGLTIAHELAHTSYSVLVLESGVQGHESEFAAGLNEIENLGEPRILDQRRVRNRTVGGTSLTWSGRCRPLDQIDFESRSWIPLSGWPLAASDLEPCLSRAAGYLGLQPLNYDDELLQGSNHFGVNVALHGNDLHSVFWQFSRSSALNEDYVRFGPRYHKLKAANIRLLADATVTELLTALDGSRLEEIRVTTQDRTSYRVRAKLTILCCGGIDNARILLASRRYSPTGVANENEVVGRFLMDHPRATLGTFPTESQASVQEEFGLFRHSSGSVLQHGLSLTPAVQRREHLLNCAAWTTQHVELDDVWRALRILGRNGGSGRLSQGRTVLRNVDQIVTGLWKRFVLGRELPRRMGRLDLDAMLEQSPDSESRITLSDRTDALGMPLPQIDWKIGEMERRTAIHLGHAVNAALARAGKPQAVLVDWVRNRRPEDAVFIDQAHPIGATRMSENPAHGVVDSNCKVHGIENLYIAGSSVFPTGGHANPTLMIVAMAVRLADRLRSLEYVDRTSVHLQADSAQSPRETCAELSVARCAIPK